MSKKTSLSRGNNAVQGTNDSSIVSKCSMAGRGYFQDPYLQHFVAKTRRRAPLINRGYYVRAKAVDHMLRCFITHTGANSQVISLGAGFDSAYFRLKAEGLLQDTLWFEVDFLETMKRKAALINNSQVLLDVLQLGQSQMGSEGQGHKQTENMEANIVLDCSDFKMVGVDLRDTGHLERCLKMTGVDLTLPTLLLSECVMTYIEPKSSSAIIQWAANTFTNAVFVTYEQILPNDPFGMVIGIHTYPDADSQEKRYRELGWSSVHSMNMNHFYTNILDLEERRRVDTLEPFDEYEEWHLKCCHYLVLCAYRGSCSALSQDMMGKKVVAQPHASSDSLPFDTFSPSFSVKRYGHVSLTSAKHLIMFGGFGEEAGQHRRLDGIYLFDLEQQGVPIRINISGSHTIGKRMYHTATLLSDQRIFVYGGRSSPAQPCQSAFILKILHFVNGDKVQDPSKHQHGSLSSVVNKMESESRGQEIRVEGESSAICYTENGSDSCSGTDCGIMTATDNESKGYRGRSGNLQECNDGICSLTEPNMSKSKERCNQSICDNVDSSINTCDVIAESSVEEVHFKGTIMPCPRWRHSATFVVIGVKDYIAVFGGRSSTEPFVLGDCFLLSISAMTWTKVEASGPSPSPRHSHSSSEWSHPTGTGSPKLVLACGLGEDMTPYGDVHILDLDMMAWEELETQGTLQPRYSHTSHVLDNRLVLVGGVGLQENPGITVVNLTSGLVQEFTIPVCSPQGSPVLLYNHTSHVLQDGNMVVLGGGGNCFSFGTHLNDEPLAFTLP
ncbi:tRNA wybutosine-synthesizing protein 4 isoform X2 [Lingula anatina]|uniref:tRNA wybutosine-synthesizing protein 4 n=1 Tax=Lingula anatina TaxID=7574 RepID=A0A1S3IWT0_LINAN|nr:tRNA wybutosine-synthesizing protein 4 isoform X2 [Lingula anatina]|eukprot:XP_013402426.1 tRNA wybutosine-synthesizing protein 4 isoform X2 [Lingula anatina]